MERERERERERQREREMWICGGETTHSTLESNTALKIMHSLLNKN